LLSVSKFTIVGGSLWWHTAGSSLAESGTDCHVSATFQPFLPGLVCCSCFCLLYILSLILCYRIPAAIEY